MKLLRFALCFLLLVVVGLSVGDAQLYNFHTYTVEDGLSQSQVKALYQDKFGSLWIGTLGGGLSRYNSKRYVNFTSINGLADNYITSISGDLAGNCWIGTNKGVSRYNGRTFKNFTTKDGLPHMQVNALVVDKNGGVWVGTDRGLCYLVYTDSSHAKPTVTVYSAADGLGDDHITSLLIDRKNILWVGTKNGLEKLEKSKKTGRIHFLTINQSDGLPSADITGMAQDVNGYLWFTTAKGVCKLISKSNENFKFLNYTTHNGLIADRFNSVTTDLKGNIWFCGDPGISRVVFENNTATLQLVNYTYHSGLPEGHVNIGLEDREGNMWFGSESGLVRYGGDRFIAYTKEQDLPSNAVRAIVGDKDGNVLVGTDKGATLITQGSKAQEKTIIDYTKKYNLHSGATNCLLLDHDNNIWMGGDGVVYKLVQTGKTSDYRVITYSKAEYFTGNVLCILQDSRGNIWFGTADGLVCYDGTKFKLYSTADGLPDNAIVCLYEDRKGTLWMGSEKGLCSYDGVKFQKFASYSELKLQVTSIAEDESGNLWLGSYSGCGLTRFDGQNYTNIGEDKGLISNMVYQLVLDNAGSLWIGTNKGLDLLDVNKFNKTDSAVVKHYGKNEGFTGIQCSPNAVYKDFTGNIWFGTVKGVIKYSPKDDVNNLVPPVIQFTGMKLFNRDDVNWSKYSDSINPDNGLPKHLVLPYSQNSLTIQFLGVSLTNPEKTLYKYKLEGSSDDWMETQDQSAPLQNLSPGDYVFKLKACNNDGIWNTKPIEISFTITPPFYNTPWFYAISIVLVSAGIVLIVRRRTQQLQRSKKELEQRIIERTSELHVKNKELEKLSIVARDTVNAIAIANPEGEVEWINESYTRMTGYTLADLQQTDGKTVFQAWFNPHLKTLVHDCIVSKQSSVFETLNTNKQGEAIWIHTTLTPILDEAGAVKQLVFVDTDITETKQAEEIIRRKNKDKMGSINYAKLIQEAILPTKEEILKVFPESFLFFKPREVVSGDFYWFSVVGDTAYIAVADSTGHGVPGAFMSLIGSSLLNETVVQKGVLETDEILNQLDKEIKVVLKHGKEGIETKDGMDVALVAINLKTKVMHYSGAMRPLYIINKNPNLEDVDHEYLLKVYPPDKRSIGGDVDGRVPTFTKTEIQLVKGDAIYLFTDGYADQFGGPRGKKITNARFKESFLSLQVLSMNLQGKLLEKDLRQWMGKLEQVDDILVMGIKF